ncbi:helix-turn-helix domain-containing protein [Sphingomonas sp. SUN019]|uniref:IclR family transcriptional regulator n=1 Tax=Sphingomonas sp. SUN019 TaxID=2937788 RepID=UPI002164A82C|nr:helix-turn-helix domain-containing protein [Sphingomonas sp. SUN019]UVO50473.1 helix-turn-helix domain-containing protein [Sphingomonas sp. SUN019]
MNAPFAPPAKLVGAVTAALAILRCLGRHAEPLRLSDVVREEGLNSSTALNILRTLEYEGLIAFDRRSKRYALASGLADLAAPLDASHATERAMAAAAQELGATIGLWRVVSEEVELVQVADSSAVMRIAFTIGRRLPMFLGAMGRLVAARGDWSADQLARGFAAVPWARTPEYETWLGEVAQARADQAAIDAGHVNAGILGIAVPVERDGPLHHVLAAALFDTGDADIPAITNRLRQVAATAEGASPCMT